MAGPSRTAEVTDLRGDRSSEGEEAYFDPVYLTHTVQRSYRVPAIRSRRVLEGPPTAFFPLSRKELGDVWSGAALTVWEVQPMEDG